MMMHHQQGPQSFEVQYLGAAMLSQMATGLGTLQKPLKDLYYAYQRPTGPIPLNSNLLTVTDQGLVVSQLVPSHMGNFSKGAEVFYGMPFLQFWDVVQFVTVKEKEKKFKCAFESLSFDQNRSRDNLFAALDYKKEKHLTTAVHPIIFAIVLRRTTGLKALDLHAFVCVNDQQASDLSGCLRAAHAAHAQLERNDTGAYGYNQFSGSENILFSGGTPLYEAGSGGNRLPPSRPIPKQHPAGFGHQEAMPVENGGSYMSDVYGNLKSSAPGSNVRNTDPIYGNRMAPDIQGNRMGYELSQSDFIKDTRDQQNIYGGFPVYGNSAALKPPGPQQNNFLSRSQNNIYQNKEEIVRDQPRHLQRHAVEDIYGMNNVGATKSLERPDHQQPFSGNQPQNDRDIYGQFSREGIYGQAPGPKDNSGGYGRAVYNVGKKFDDPQPVANISKEPTYGFMTRTEVNPAGQKFDDNIYGNNVGMIQKPVSAPATNFGGFGASNFSKPGNQEPPARHPGTSPSYRRKFPGGGDWGKNNWEGNSAAPQAAPSKPVAQPPVGGYNAYSNQKEVEYKPLPHAPSRDIPAPQPTPVQPLPVQPPPALAPEADDSVPLGARKSLFGIFPRGAEKSSKTPAPSKYIPPAAPEPARYIPAAAPDPSRDRQFSGGEVSDKPIALVQPRKVTGIRVLPFGEDIYGKMPAKREDQSRPLANEVERSNVFPAKSGAVTNVLDDPDRPTKDKEIASVFGSLNIDSNNAIPQSKINFESSLGYLP